MPFAIGRFHLTPILLMSVLLFASSCGSDGLFHPVGEDEGEQIKEALNNRSFRQFVPSKDASPRKAVILDFFDGIRVWPSIQRTATRSTSGRLPHKITAS